MRLFLSRIDEQLRPLAGQIRCPSTENLSAYGRMIEDFGGADVCYGGVGWCGHFTFWEAQLFEFGDDVGAFSNARLVEPHPLTVMQNALQRCRGALGRPGWPSRWRRRSLKILPTASGWWSSP